MKIQINAQFFVIYFTLICSIGVAHADLRLAGVFSDNMVLQRDARDSIWGWAAPGQKVTVEFAGKKQSAVADQSGKWMMKLSPMSASFEGRTLVVRAGDAQLQMTNVLVGEVWLASGQSNMGVSLNAAWYGKEEAAHANYPAFRYMSVAVADADKLQTDVPVNKKTGRPERWVICSPNTAPHIAGVCYFFGLELQKELGVPVGILRSSQGGTPVEAWTSHEAFQQTAAGRECLAEWNEKFAHPDQDRARYDKETRDATEAAKAKGKSAPWFPGYQEPAESSQRPSNLYNAMIAPLAPFAFRGVIWYQGENNANPLARAQAYRELFPALIRDWRSLWHENFPFLFVQLPNYRDYGTNRLNWPALRESQVAALELPRTGMAVAIDVGTPNDIHPPDKKPVAHRLVLQALKIAYGRDNDADGPMFVKARFKDGHAVIFFKNLDVGLVSKSGEELKSFTVAGKDQRFYPAQARIEGDHVVVSSVQVPSPVAVRYAFINAPEVNLFAKNGLPVAPFRTDDWPLVNPDDD
jgi:sialate O-acetylesterase